MLGFTFKMQIWVSALLCKCVCVRVNHVSGYCIKIRGVKERIKSNQQAGALYYCPVFSDSVIFMKAIWMR